MPCFSRLPQLHNRRQSPNPRRVSLVLYVAAAATLADKDQRRRWINQTLSDRNHQQNEHNTIQRCDVYITQLQRWWRPRRQHVKIRPTRNRNAVRHNTRGYIDVILSTTVNNAMLEACASSITSVNYCAFKLLCEMDICLYGLRFSALRILTQSLFTLNIPPT